MNCEGCVNTDKCYRCKNGSLYKAEKKRLPLRKVSPNKTSTPWRKLEHQVAETLTSCGYQAKLQPASGSKWYAPGDVISSDFLVECKSHPVSARGEKYHTITKEQLKKIEDEAAVSGRLPIYAFQFKGDTEVYVVMKMDVLEEILQATRKGI